MQNQPWYDHAITTFNSLSKKGRVHWYYTLDVLMYESPFLYEMLGKYWEYIHLTILTWQHEKNFLADWFAAMQADSTLTQKTIILHIWDDIALDNFDHDTLKNMTIAKYDVVVFSHGTPSIFQQRSHIHFHQVLDCEIVDDRC